MSQSNTYNYFHHALIYMYSEHFYFLFLCRAYTGPIKIYIMTIFIVSHKFYIEEEFWTFAVDTHPGAVGTAENGSVPQSLSLIPYHYIYQQNIILCETRRKYLYSDEGIVPLLHCNNLRDKNRDFRESRGFMDIM